MKRLNPSTGLPFKRGDRREDGYLFNAYQKTKTAKTGYFHESWLKPQNMEKVKAHQKKTNDKQNSTLFGKIQTNCWGAKNRALKNNIDFNLTPEYLLSIFPKNCPVFDFELDWFTRTGKTKVNSPSLDRIDPSKGYIVGNVQWLSSLANKMKQDATPEQLKKFGEWAIR
jgi:hypothetical protein